MNPTLLATASQRKGIMVLTKALTTTIRAATPAEAKASTCTGSFSVASKVLAWAESCSGKDMRLAA